mgnify:CR=1 FL=1
MALDSNGSGRGLAGTTGGVLAVLIWSFAAPVVALIEDMDAFLYVAFGDAIGAGVFLAIWLVRRHNPLPELTTVPL